MKNKEEIVKLIQSKRDEDDYIATEDILDILEDQVLNQFRKDEKSVLNLLVEKDNYKRLSEEYKDVLKYILNRCYSIGAPLNENVLRFTNKQLKFLINIVKEIKSVL